MPTDREPQDQPSTTRTITREEFLEKMAIGCKVTLTYSSRTGPGAHRRTVAAHGADRILMTRDDSKEASEPALLVLQEDDTFSLTESKGHYVVTIHSINGDFAVYAIGWTN